ncbi:hypothetical protein [Streptomyces natalensis]|uniref:ATP-binding protein n=1 Tax=Streptomyces natalensis ATCC 27448 TaxID=1240678 RepID=A0A0D7CDW1_9ACTN|nr:hypothetical protein [Streptomyces natalensis]KIZ14438.1 hypothetical protein SNA_35725 [Streptomyces natalensis ATCC 27448]
MKQGTIKTLGAAALGAAFVVTAAGAASAASVAPSVPVGSDGLVKSATDKLPVHSATEKLQGATRTVAGTAHVLKPAGVTTHTNSKGNSLGPVPIDGALHSLPLSTSNN